MSRAEGWGRSCELQNPPGSPQTLQVLQQNRSTRIWGSHPAQSPRQGSTVFEGERIMGLKYPELCKTQLRERERSLRLILFTCALWFPCHKERQNLQQDRRVCAAHCPDCSTGWEGTFWALKAKTGHFAAVWEENLKPHPCPYIPSKPVLPGAAAGHPAAFISPWKARERQGAPVLLIKDSMSSMLCI